MKEIVQTFITNQGTSHRGEAVRIRWVLAYLTERRLRIRLNIIQRQAQKRQ